MFGKVSLETHSVVITYRSLARQVTQCFILQYGMGGGEPQMSMGGQEPPLVMNGKMCG